MPQTPDISDRYVPVKLAAVDLATGATVAAEFYVNGVRVRGTAALPPGTTAIVQARAAGYETLVQQLAVTPSLRDPVVLLMRPAAGGIPVRFQISPPVAGARLEFSGPAQAGPATSDLEGQVEVRLAPGTWTVSVVAEGYQRLELPVTVARPAQFDLLLVREAAPESERSTARTWMELPQPALAESPSESLVPLSDLAPAYYTSAQCRLYIGRLFIDELQSIRWVLHTNVVPVYGYASQAPDAFARGRSQVQGELVINYVHPGYLLAAVEQADAPSPSLRAGNLGEIFLPDRFAQLEARRSMRPWRRREPVPANPLYLHRPFDMRLEIGDGARRSSRFLERCVLISNEIVIAPDGQPVAEAYGFLARRAR